jgi:DNA-binding MarR family transcriptional regulator
MPSPSGDFPDQVLTALRRVIRAVDLHSRQLVRSHGLTSPQVLALNALIQAGELTAGDLSRALNLSQATVTDILNRLERRGLVLRVRSCIDKRRVFVAATEQARELLKNAPPLLQEQFLARLRGLADWEQTLLLSSLQRIAGMMDAGDIDASPLLACGPVTPAPGVAEGRPRGTAPANGHGGESPTHPS